MQEVKYDVLNGLSAVPVETGCHESIPSIDTCPVRPLDLDVIIEVMLNFTLFLILCMNSWDLLVIMGRRERLNP